MPTMHPLCSPIQLHATQIAQITPSMSFDPSVDFQTQRIALREKFLSLVGVPQRSGNGSIVVEYEDTTDPRFDEIRFVTESEEGLFVPAHLFLPKQRRERLPLVICLQGHSPGMHVSLAREPYPSKESIVVEGDRDFCIQAVARGYAALAMEQRGFGELNFDKEKPHSCLLLGGQALMLGRTLIGERICDISAIIDAVEQNFSWIDCSRIGVMGNSGGGTASYFAACVDERIKVAMPSSAFCTFSAAWGTVRHCICGYVPNLIQYMEMDDMAMMIAPRPLIVVNGVHDHLQPFDAAQKAFEKVKEIYRAAGAPDACQMVIGSEGHRFYADLAWEVFDRLI